MTSKRAMKDAERYAKAHRRPVTTFDIRAAEMAEEGLPVAVKTDSRICFGISYFATEAEADRFGEYIRLRGDTYNGGYMHGVPCGRDWTWDHEDKTTGEMRYAVTTA